MPAPALRWAALLDTMTAFAPVLVRVPVVLMVNAPEFATDTAASIRPLVLLIAELAAPLLAKVKLVALLLIKPLVLLIPLAADRVKSPVPV